MGYAPGIPGSILQRWIVSLGSLSCDSVDGSQLLLFETCFYPVKWNLFVQGRV